MVANLGMLPRSSVGTESVFNKHDQWMGVLGIGSGGNISREVFGFSCTGIIFEVWRRCKVNNLLVIECSVVALR